ncbi:hypothetical protein ACQ4PT_034344 [Festuca glaucescens]
MEHPVPNFVSTTKFCPRVPDRGWRSWHYEALDCRHSRVLLVTADAVMPGVIIVWDPMTGWQREMYKPDKYTMYRRHHGAAVLCTASGCNHLACHEGPFLVVFVGMVKSHGGCFARPWVFSSETGEWSASRFSLDLDVKAVVLPVPPVLVGDALHFLIEHDAARDLGILKYDMGSTCLSLIFVPVSVRRLLCGDAILMAMADGSLGLARRTANLTIKLWSMQMVSDNVVSWTPLRVVDLKILLPIQRPMKNLILNGSVEGRDIIFVNTDLGIYEIDIKSLRLKKHLKGEKELMCLIPYMGFYNPQSITVDSYTKIIIVHT